MGLTEDIRDGVKKSFDEHKDPVVLDKEAAAYKAVAEAELARAQLWEHEPGNRKRGEMRQWVMAIATILGPLLLLATFWLQLRQFSESSRLARDQFAETTRLAREANDRQMDQFRATTERARDDAEDAAFRDLLTHAKETRGPEVVFAMSMLKPFLDSNRYKRQAREIAISLLGGMVHAPTFKLIFRDVVKHTDWTNLDDLMTLSRTLCENDSAVREDLKDLEGKADPKPYAAPPRTKTELQRELDGLVDEIQYVSEAIAEFLQDEHHYPSPDGMCLDLHGVQFTRGTDLSGLVPGSANLRGTIFFKCNVSDINIGAAEDVEDSDWEGTPWWRAKSLSPKLLEYLTKKFAYQEKQEYYGTAVTQEEYDREVKRLLAGDAQSSSAAPIGQ